MLLLKLTFAIIFAYCIISQASGIDLPLNPDFYAQAGGIGPNQALFCKFPYYDPYTNLTIEKPEDSTVDHFFCLGFNNHISYPNITDGPVSYIPAGTSFTWGTDCPVNTTNCTQYDYRFIVTDSTFENPESVYENMTLPGQLNGTIVFGDSQYKAGTDTYRYVLPIGYSLFFYKEVLSGNRTTYGAINVTCPLNEFGAIQPYCNAYDFEEEPEYKRHLSDFISWFTLALLWISIGGSLATLLTFTVHTDIRTYPIRLIMYLCVCIIMGDFFFLMGFELGFQKNDAVCYLTGMTIHGFFLGNFCWTLCIAFNFYQMIVRRNREFESLEKFYHLFSWGLPIFCVEWVGGWEYYGLQGGGVCYVTDPYFLFAFFFLPGLIILALNIILFFFVAREIHDTLASVPAGTKHEKRKECRVYISICISIGLSWVFGFIMILFTVYWINLIFLFLFTITTGTQGFLIFIFYCLNLKVLSKWARLLGRCIPFFRRWEHLDTTQGTTRGTSESSARSNTSSSADASMDSEMSSTTDD